MEPQWNRALPLPRLQKNLHAQPQYANTRGVAPNIEQAIERALEERIAYNAIKRAFRVGWDTIARIAKKS